jgi:hypothetical protein
MRWCLPFLLAVVLSSVASVAWADDAAIRARLDALEAPRDGEADLVAAAERALQRAASDRAAGDAAAATRAERIADATVTLLETRRRRAEAETALASARARRAEVAARAAAARQTHESDERERARLAPPAEPSP